jgi:DNA-binding MarR family transcriptional regulator
MSVALVSCPLGALPPWSRGSRPAATQGRGESMDREGSLEPEGVEDTTTARDAPLKLEEFLPYRLNVVAALVSQALSRIYVERYAIGVPEWRVLVTLGQYGVMTAKAIGAHSHMHKTKVSRAVAVLERRKLLTRKSNNADLRENLLSLTRAGRAMYEDLAPIALEFSRKLTAVLSASEYKALDDAIDRLTQRSSALAAAVAPRRSRS